jgi:beta-lactam-binding protein with PASTA domain
MEWLVAVITVSVVVVTIVWFVKDIRKETLAEIESRGFETLAQLLVKAGIK